MKKESLIEGIMSLCEQFVNKSSEKAITEEKPVLKSIDSDKKLFTAVVLRPDVPDAHGDIYDADVVEKACHSYNEYCRKAKLQHLVETSLIVPVESWIAKSSHTLGDGEVLEGDWVMTARIDNDELWEMCLKGEFTGFSVGCTSLVEELDEE
jgi:hypothetical protein